MTTYRLNGKGKYSALNYRYTEKESLFHRLRDIPNDFKGVVVKTEHQVISVWSSFAKEALIGEFSESKIKCWQGHYEQFGRVMLQLANISYYKKDARGEWVKTYHSLLPEPEDVEYIFRGPSGTEDRRYYRCWFSLIGHPDFMHEKVTGMEAFTYSYIELILNMAFQDFSVKLRMNSEVNEEGQ